MTDAVKYLAEYTPFGFEIEHVDLTFDLDPKATRVHAKIAFRPNPATENRDFFLHGREVKLISASIDGAPVTPDVTAAGLTCDVPNAPFLWESVVEIAPETNTSLEGLYMSGGMYCTQCEAEGFRRITFYPDRPDVMAPFKVRINSDEKILLSNGNPTADGDGWAEWTDPHPKPAYLFALVAGDLIPLRDSFTTKTGQDVDLNLWVRPGDEDKCDWGMQSLKLSMDWDERVYGREYDLDVFNIVAVDDFNGGAMENKGLNLFNTALVLAAPAITTDTSYERIESVIAHEYFHNWTGNRITCRDWFQLSLKEGLTVFRDQQFTSDVRSAPVKRIDDVLRLRAYQFPEDAGPLAHPVRPEEYIEIDNFYSTTVYEKGAEVIGMLKTLVGDDAYYKALDLYFTRHDGQACTVEDWLKVFEDTTGRDLSQFKLWYRQAGTPKLTITEKLDGQTYSLTIRQDIPDTPGQTGKSPMVIPVKVGILSEDGREILPSHVLELTETEQTFQFALPDGSGHPVPSILRGFSAPVTLDTSALPDHRATLLAHDTDPFNRWEAARSLAKSSLLRMIYKSESPDPAYLEGLATVLNDDSLDPAYMAFMLDLPSEADLVQGLVEAGLTPDPMAVRTALRDLRAAMAERLEPRLVALYDANQVPGAFDPSAGPAGQRALANACLTLLTLRDGGARAEAQFDAADNMTLSLGAMTALLRIGKGDAQSAAFEKRWRGERLALDLWFSAMMASAEPDYAVDRLNSLMAHDGFDEGNPNRLRAVVGPLAATPSLFHATGGAAYEAIADIVLRLDSRNSRVAARSMGAFQTWKLYDADRQDLARAQLTRIAAHEGLSSDTSEMVGRLLA